MRHKISKIITCFLAATTLALSAYFFFLHPNTPVAEEKKEEENLKTEMIVEISPDKIKEAGIEVQAASPGYLRQIIHSPAKIILNENTVLHLTPKIVGTVVEIRKNIGDYVAQNEILAILDSPEMADAKSDYLNATKKLILANNKLEREKNLFERKIAAEQDYLNSLNEAQQAHIQRDRTQQKLLTLGLHPEDIQNLSHLDSFDLSRYELRSPIEGIVVRKDISYGDIIGEKQEIYVIANPTKVWVEMMVFPKDLRHIHQGLEADLICPDGHNHHATIISISPIIDDRTRASRVIAELDNQHGEWHPGMFVCTQVKGDFQNVSLAIPKGSVQKINGHNCVFICTHQGFEVRPLHLGRQDDYTYEVLAGLSPGENYAYKNTFLLKAEQGKDEVHED
jgi:membrane fusion protein, heavy metal efflux system